MTLNWLKLCGVCGIVAPVIAFTGITVSLALTVCKGKILPTIPAAYYDYAGNINKTVESLCQDVNVK